MALLARAHSPAHARRSALEPIAAGLLLAAIIVVSPARASCQTSARWEALPNSALALRLPASLPPGSTGPGAIIGGWNSAAFDSTRNQLLVLAAGGHGDYAGNEVYAFQHATQQFVRLTVPSTAVTMPPIPSADPLSDGTPASRHSYGGVGYDPDKDAAVICGGSRWWDGNPTPLCWRFLLSKNTWENLGPLSSGAAEGRTVFYATAGTPFMVWDPQEHKFLVREGSTPYYSYLNFTTLRSEPSACAGTFTGYGSNAAVIDPVGRALYIVGSGQTRRLSLPPRRPNVRCGGDPATSGPVDVRLATTGATEIENLNVWTKDKTVQQYQMDPYGGIGLAWDPVAGVVVAYGRTADHLGGRVYTLKPSTLVWTAWEADSSGAQPPVPTGTGMWNKLWFHGPCLYAAIATPLPVYRACSLPWRTGPPAASTLPADSTRSLPAVESVVAMRAAGEQPAVRQENAPASATPNPKCQPDAGKFCPPPMTWRWSMLPQRPAEVGPITTWIGGRGTVQGGSSKHMRMAYDPTSGRVILTGGDRAGVGDGNGQPSVWATADGHKWTMLSPPCISESEQMYPARPDNVIWAIDAKRNRAIIMPGFYFGTAKATSDCPGPTPVHSALVFNLATNRWEPAPWPAPHTGPNSRPLYGSDDNSTWGAVDPVGDALYRYFWNGGWGATLEKLDLATNTWTFRQLGERTGQQPSDGALRNSFGNRAQPALDVQGRALYFVNSSNRLYRVQLGEPDHRGEWVGQAPASCTPPDDSSQELYMVFDSDHRAVLRICTPNLAGEVTGVAAYFVDHGRWVWYAAPTDQPYPVIANTFAYSPTCKCVISIGGHGIRSQTTGRALENPVVNWTFRLQ